jgi:hypothetical protein
LGVGLGAVIVSGVTAVATTFQEDDIDAGASPTASTTLDDSGDESADEAGGSTSPTSAPGEPAAPEPHPAPLDPTTGEPVEVASSGAVDPLNVAPDELPVEATVVSATTGLADGDVVTIEVAARDGSEIYVAEARLCAGDQEISEDIDMRPSLTGKCVSSPLSAGSDDFVSVASVPPYESLRLDFRAGVGSQTYTMQSGDEATITCDREHPCVVAVKFQVPNGYGFRTYPVEYR